MKSLDIAQLRLSHQYLAGNPLKTVSEVVTWLGAVQAQPVTARPRWPILGGGRG